MVRPSLSAFSVFGKEFLSGFASLDATGTYDQSEASPIPSAKPRKSNPASRGTEFRSLTGHLVRNQKAGNPKRQRGMYEQRFLGNLSLADASGCQTQRCLTVPRRRCPVHRSWTHEANGGSRFLSNARLPTAPPRVPSSPTRIQRTTSSGKSARQPWKPAIAQ